MGQPPGHTNQHTNLSQITMSRSYLPSQGLSLGSDSLPLPSALGAYPNLNQRSGFSSLGWLRASEHSALGNRVQGP